MTYAPNAVRYPLRRHRYGNWIALIVLAVFFLWWIV